MFSRVASRVASTALRAQTAALVAGRRTAYPVAAPALTRMIQTREKSSLVSILKREIEEEKGNCLEGEELEELHAKISEVFRVVETPGNMEVVLEGEVKGDSIRIKFDTQDIVEIEDDYMGDDEDEEGEIPEEEEEEDEEDHDELPGIRLLAEITRDNQGLQFECVASSNLAIERVRYLGDFAKEAKNEDLYFGPNFVDLELDLQEAFHKYLLDRHIDDELAQFVTQYADLKEQREYLGFLESAASFIKK